MIEPFTGTPLEGLQLAYAKPKKRVILSEPKMRWLRKLLILWSGLSESNRHLNLGKVDE